MARCAGVEKPARIFRHCLLLLVIAMRTSNYRFDDDLHFVPFLLRRSKNTGIENNMKKINVKIRHAKKNNVFLRHDS